MSPLGNLFWCLTTLTLVEFFSCFNGISSISACAHWEKSGSIFTAFNPAAVHMGKILLSFLFFGQTSPSSLSACTVRCSNPFTVLRSSDGYMLPIAVVSAMMSNLPDSLTVMQTCYFCMSFSYAAPFFSPSGKSSPHPFICKLSAFTTAEVARFCRMLGSQTLGVSVWGLSPLHIVHMSSMSNEKNKKAVGCFFLCLNVVFQERG